MRAWLGLISIAFAACASDVEEDLKDGVDALAECDIRGAHAAFAEAYESDPDDPRAALGFALTDLALLPEDPAVTAVLADVGFTGAIDMQTLVFGPEGALARYARGDTCDSIDAFVEANVPYPPLADSTIDEYSLIRADMTLADVVAAARELEPRLGRIAAALVTAASGSTEPIEVSGGCGLGELTIQPPELLAAAALLETIRSMTALAAAYDWQINFGLFIEQRSDQIPALVDSFNQHLGHLVDASAAAPSAERLRAALGHLGDAADAAAAITAPVAGGVFDWSQMPVSLANEISEVAGSAAAATEGPAAIAGVEPSLEVDGSVLLSAGVDLGAASSPIFSVGTDEFGNFISVDGDALAATMTEVVDPAPWSSAAPAYSWQLSTELDTFDSGGLTEPSRRYTDVFACMTDPGL